MPAERPECDQSTDASKSPTPLEVATGSAATFIQNPHPGHRSGGHAKHVRSACESHREWIEEQVRLGRNAMAIYQDLVERFGFTHKYNSVKRFVRLLKRKDPEQYDRLEFLMGKNPGGLRPGCANPAQQREIPAATPVHHDLEVFRRAFRKVVWNSSKETWCRLHEEAFRYSRAVRSTWRSTT